MVLKQTNGSACDCFWRAANYITAVTLYLNDNVFLQEELQPHHFKEKIVGHWGTCPGINFIYAHLSAFVQETAQQTLLVIGPGHAGPAVLACLFLEGALREPYARLTRNAEGLRRLARQFGAPGGFPTEIAACYPGMLYAGGELGPALSMAQGVAFDNPELLVAVVIGDGEAETGATTAAWLAAQYLDPLNAGAVLPILHLNGFRMGSPSLLSRFSTEQLTDYFSGLGYAPYFVNGSHEQMQQALHEALSQFQQRRVAAEARCREIPACPLIVLRTPKGWTAPRFLGGQSIEGGVASHKVPLSETRTEEEVREIERWLRSYHPEELFTENGVPLARTLSVLPPEGMRLGQTLLRLQQACKPLALPSLQPLASPEKTTVSPAKRLAAYLGEVIRADHGQAFRIFSPDELDSNKLDDLLNGSHAESRASGRRVLEILNEHVCQGWLQGYTLSGRYGLLASYEAFAPIISSMLSQYLKFLLETRELTWRPSLPSLNLFLTSLGWRNVFTHQNPDLIDILLTRRLPFVRIYYPIDANALLVATRAALSSSDRVSVIVATKYPVKTYSGLQTAEQHLREGFSVIRDCQSGVPDVSLVAIGDWVVEECLAAALLLASFVPALQVRVIAVSELSSLGSSLFYTHAPDDERFVDCFTRDKPVLVCFGGYPAAIEGLLFNRPGPGRFKVLGYHDSGGNHTAFSMLVEQGVDRFSLARQALALSETRGSALREPQERLRSYIEKVHERHACFVREHGRDPAWIWTEGIGEITSEAWVNLA